MNTMTGIWADAMSALTFFLALIDKAPLGFGAVIAGLCAAWGLGQFVKKWLPKFLTRDFDLSIAEQVKKSQTYSDRREFLIESMAFFGGVAGTYATYPTRQGFLLGILVGFMAPNVWTWLSLIFRPVWAYWKSKYKPVGE